MIRHDPVKGPVADAADRHRKIAEHISGKNKQKIQEYDDREKPDPTVRIMVSSSIAEFSAENASRSLARTYAQLLHSEPLKSLPARPRQNTPEPDAGQTTPTIEPPPIRTVDNKQILAE